jgi:catechol 2,3-dioxygenase-like lactoylglutathione lyase family enzyme
MELLVNLDVDDLDRAVRFYQSGLGLRPGRRLGEGVVEMLGGSSPIYLLEKARGSVAASTTAQKRDYTRHWTPVHLDFVVEDIGAAVERAVAAGATPEGGTQTQEWGHIARFADPFGHGFCLVEFRGRGYDAIAR